MCVCDSTGCFPTSQWPHPCCGPVMGAGSPRADKGSAWGARRSTQQRTLCPQRERTDRRGSSQWALAAGQRPSLGSSRPAAP